MRVTVHPVVASHIADGFTEVTSLFADRSHRAGESPEAHALRAVVADELDDALLPVVTFEAKAVRCA